MSEPQADYSGRLFRPWEQRCTVAFPFADLYHSRESGQGQAILFSAVSFTEKKYLVLLDYLLPAHSEVFAGLVYSCSKESLSAEWKKFEEYLINSYRYVE